MDARVGEAMRALDNRERNARDDADGKALPKARRPRAGRPRRRLGIKRMKARRRGDAREATDNLTNTRAERAGRFEPEAEELATLAHDPIRLLATLAELRAGGRDKGHRTCTGIQASRADRRRDFDICDKTHALPPSAASVTAPEGTCVRLAKRGEHQVRARPVITSEQASDLSGRVKAELPPRLEEDVPGRVMGKSREPVQRARGHVVRQRQPRDTRARRMPACATNHLRHHTRTEPKAKLEHHHENRRRDNVPILAADHADGAQPRGSALRRAATDEGTDGR